jgi:hypothetical protein
MDEQRPGPSRCLWLACLLLLAHAIPFLGLALVAGYSGSVENLFLELVSGGRIPLTTSYLWLFLVPASLISLVAVWKEAHQPHGGPALAASMMWMAMGALVAADAGAIDPIATEAVQLLVAGAAFVRTRAHRAAMEDGLVSVR